jgi:hypothetical protein
LVFKIEERLFLPPLVHTVAFRQYSTLNLKYSILNLLLDS